jgi:hypothetical protein
MAGGAMAHLFGVRHEDIVGAAKRKKIERVLRRVSHAQKSPSWYYNYPDAVKLYGPPPKRRVPRTDLTKKYVKDVDAAFLLKCSAATVVRLADAGRVKRIRTHFCHPTYKEAWGYRLEDVMVLRKRQQETSEVTCYEEETVTSSKIVRTEVREVVLGAEVIELARLVKRGEMSAEKFVEVVLKKAA